ncbi:MAG: SDR family NAD(P)-dependent oxidoreductase [Actinomycetota bacterium]|nr:SDR family NAD(P)-dependent oxidoreductase [Actinomycetota bacterium]
MGSLDRRRVLITGASSGIGEAAARAIVAEGGAVALGARRKDRLDGLAAELVDGGGTAVAIEADIGEEDQAKALVAQAAEKLGGLDGLVNNAGVMLLGLIQGADTDEWRRMIDVNLLGLLYCTHAAVPIMRDGGGGDVVNVSSVAGRIAAMGSAVYNMTKWGVTGFSEALRQEGAHIGVRVTCVEPGFVETELQGHNTNPMVLEQIEKAKEAAGKVLEAADIANAVVFALSQPKHVSINEVLVRPSGQTR